jgi:5'-deoxynucleotidase YfbR-like HD superfamily hydrolase
MTFIRTYSGKDFDIYNFTEESFDIESISHGLSQTCRFSGQCKKFYSVAEHSCRIAIHTYDLTLERFPDIPRKQILVKMLWGLLHDASEAYLPDMPSPFKRLPELEGFRKLEDNIMLGVANRFGLPQDIPEIVKECDTRIISNERKHLMDTRLDTWKDDVEPLPESNNMPQYGMAPQDAREWFMDIYETITSELYSCGSCQHKCE